MEGRTEASRGFEAVKAPPSPRAPHGEAGTALSHRCGPKGAANSCTPVRKGPETSRLFPNRSILAFLHSRALVVQALGFSVTQGHAQPQGQGHTLPWARSSCTPIPGKSCHHCHQYVTSKAGGGIRIIKPQNCLCWKGH